MNTGINTLIEQTKKELADLINQKLQQGMPISVVGLILDTLMYEVILLLYCGSHDKYMWFTIHPATVLNAISVEGLDNKIPISPAS